MFFADPAAAFANMRGALRSGGRTAFICWQPMAVNDYFMVPVTAALTVLPPPEAPTPGAPGQFAFGDKDRVNTILKEAGFADISIDSLEHSMEVGKDRSLEDAGKELTRSGALARMTAEISDDQRKEVIDAVVKALEAHNRDGKVHLGTRTWLVSARNP